MRLVQFKLQLGVDCSTCQPTRLKVKSQQEEKKQNPSKCHQADVP